MLKFKRHALSLFALSALLATTPHLLAQTNRASAPITLNFVNADIESVARALASLTKRSMVVDPRVKGTINVRGRLIVGASGVVEGDVTCQSSDIEGTVNGKISAAAVA